MLKVQVVPKQDKLTVDATTNKVNSLLFKVKPYFHVSGAQLKCIYIPWLIPVSLWSGEIASDEWLLCVKPLWSCLWEAWSILFARLWRSLVWLYITQVRFSVPWQLTFFSFFSGMWQAVQLLWKKPEDLCLIRKYQTRRKFLFFFRFFILTFWNVTVLK